MSDREKLTEVFGQLEDKGWVCRMNYLDCTSCAQEAIMEEAQIIADSGVPLKGYLYWHAGDDEVAFGMVGADGEGEEDPWSIVLGDTLLHPLWLGWEDFSGDGLGEPLEHLVRAGFLVTPPADEHMRILVSTPAVRSAGSNASLSGTTAA